MRALCFIFGTRPEAIKIAPVIKAARQMGPEYPVRVWVTAQHRQMLDQVLALFGIVPDNDLDVMRPRQSLTSVTTAILERLEAALESDRPDLVLVHGDTTTAMAASLAAFYQKIPVAHVEAGLRTGNKYSPYPEEINRRIAGLLAELHFAPTERARAELLTEGVPDSSIYVTGNTVIDALLSVVRRIEGDEGLQRQLETRFKFLTPEKKLLLVTGHRRENFGQGFLDICHALAAIVDRHPDVELLYPVHLNPNVQGPVSRILGGRERIHLVEPVDYLPFVYLLRRSHLVITDSGGVQEEAPSLGKPVLVMRARTERPEAVEAGTVRLVGTDREAILRETSALLTDPELYRKMSHAHNPYGDGQAAGRIVQHIRAYFEK